MASTSEEFFAAIEAGDVARVRAMLEDEPSVVSVRDGEGVSAVMRARYRFDPVMVEVVQSFVDQMDVFEAAAAGDTDRLTEVLTEVLAEDPAAADRRSGDGFTALHFAAFFGRPAAARLLLDRGASVDARGTGWMVGTALHSAATGQHAEVIAVLLEAGADANARQAGGWTPLHAAARNGDFECVRLLLASGADPAATADDGVSVLEMASGSGHEPTVAAIAAALER